MHRTTITTSIATTTLTSILAIAGTARATPTLTPLVANAAHAAPIIETTTSFGLAPGLIVEDVDGSFQHLTFDGTHWHALSPIPGANAVNGKGLSVVYDYLDGGTYVFEIEQSGLYETRSLDGTTWSGWCHIDARTDLASAPSAVFNSTGFRVFAQTTSNALVAWSVDTHGGFCQSRSSQVLGTTYNPPMATWWGAERVDVFGGDGAGHLEHFWSDDGNTYYSQHTFAVRGADVAYPLSTKPGSLAVTTTGYGTLDVVFHTGTSVLRLYWRDQWLEEDLADVTTAIVTASPVYATECYGSGCSSSWAASAGLYTRTQSNQPAASSYALFGDGNVNAYNVIVPAQPLYELSSATMMANNVHVLFAVNGTYLYWTATGDGT